jgi:hypothetical protein
MTRAPRIVFTRCADGQPRSAHERASQAWVAQRLAGLLGWEFGGEYDPRHRPATTPYFVPDETLSIGQATRLGIHGEDDLFGGVVPHAFVASKVITHPLPAADSAAPHGWQHGLAPDLAAAVLAGFSVFDPDEIETAGERLLEQGHRVRLKEPQARGGNGQHLFADAVELRSVLARLDRESVRRHGVVLEQHVERAVTCSVGEVRIGGTRMAYLGTQRQHPGRSGNDTYAGTSLRAVRGGLEALHAVAAGLEREALDCARRYDAAVAAAYPGFFASRRNYDVVAGHDAHGHRCCGVLEQSWRLGGASPAEVIALAALRQHGTPAALEASCHESYDPAQVAPAGAEVHFHDPSATHGPLLKYAQVDGSDGNPA